MQQEMLIGYGFIFFETYGMVPASITTLGVLIWTHLSNVYFQGQNSSHDLFHVSSTIGYQIVRELIIRLEGTLGTYNRVIFKCFLSQEALTSKTLTLNG